jgi:uncharacterized protein YtpQ (UPF0354 family)
MPHKHKTADLLRSVLPQFFPAHWLTDAPDLVFTDFPSRIRVGYVLRQTDGYSYVMQPELANAGISLPELHEAALLNLRSLSMPELKIGKTPGGPELFLGEAEDSFTSARILLPDVRRKFAQHLGPEYYAAIPCRDWFTCWSLDQTDEWKARNIASARQTFLDDEYNLSPDVFLVSDGQFSIYLSQDVDA